MTEITPFKLKPSGKDYIWGGQRLNSEFGKNIDMDPLAESWECSTHPDGPSYVVGGEFDGKELAEVIRTNPAFLGRKHIDMTELPIIVKLLDANKDLSVQVHPTDEYALAHENGQRGKTEMWYILDACGDACLVYGLKKTCTVEEIRNAIDSNTLENYLNKVKIKKGEMYFIPAGTIHTVCAGCLIAEIQESSNLTYRLYDYGRVGKDGKKRPLHVDKALAVAKLEKAEINNRPVCEYFDVRVMTVGGNGDKCAMSDGSGRTRCSGARVEGDAIEGSVCYKTDENSYSVLLCTEGKGIIEFVSDNLEIEGDAIEFSKGDCIFVPAESVQMKIIGRAEMLDIRG